MLCYSGYNFLGHIGWDTLVRNGVAVDVEVRLGGLALAIANDWIEREIWIPEELVLFLIAMLEPLPMDVLMSLVSAMNFELL